MTNTTNPWLVLSILVPEPLNFRVRWVLWIFVATSDYGLPRREAAWLREMFLGTSRVLSLWGERYHIVL